MNVFAIHDGRSMFWQWDTERKLIVTEDTENLVHFCNGTGDCSLVCAVYELDGQRVVNVPNILLQTALPISVYVYVKDSEGAYTKRSALFNVHPRTRPEDYVYTEDDAKSWSDLDERVRALEEGGGGGGGGSGAGGITEEADPTVPAWAKSPEKPSYTAEEVGALPASTVIPTVPTNVSAFQNDAGYLTEHQDLSGYAKKDEIPAPVTDEHINALIDAKLAELPAVPTYTGEVEVE